ncbi:MAG: NeuD/PglB/VioB family sugar acetyltransferase [Flavobacteriales bacterium]|nr:NeuD/PglB/VioB family sugar acetyltransferase [Flavobacteriales bacterium]
MKGKTEIILIGGGGHCKSVIDVIEFTELYQIIGILDVVEKMGNVVSGYKIIGSVELIPELLEKGSSFCISLGQMKSSEKRVKYFELISNLGGDLPVIISPKATISKNVLIGSGTVIHHNCVLNTESIIGKNCIVNTGAVIEHESKVGNHCHVSTGAYVNGQCVIGEGVFIGSKSVVSNNVHISNNSVIGVGSVVVKSIENTGVYFGNPAIKRD